MTKTEQKYFEFFERYKKENGVYPALRHYKQEFGVSKQCIHFYLKSIKEKTGVYGMYDGISPREKDTLDWIKKLKNPSQKSIAKEMGVSQSFASMMIRKLEEKGIIEVIRYQINVL